MRKPVDSPPGVDQVAGVDGARHAVRVLVLGPLAVDYDGRPLHVAGTHRRRLLAVLASGVGRVVSIDALVDALWGGDPPATAARTIQSHIARLRGSFAGVGAELIETAAGGYRLALDPGAVDATEFELLAGQGRRRLGAGDFAGATSVLDRALSLWRGDAYVDFARSAEFAAAEAVRLNVERWAAVEDYVEARLESGAFEPAIVDVERLVAKDPGRERAWGLLMRALYAAGRQHDALVAFQRARAALADGFGVDPGSELRALERRILDQDPALMIRRQPVVPPALGRDSSTFVGRDRERAWLIDAWRAAVAGSGQLRLLLGPADSGRTRLASELTATAAIDGGQAVHVRGEDGFEPPPGVGTDAATPGSVVDRVTERSRAGPVLVVVDDAEWCDATTVRTVVGLAGAIEHAAVMLLVIADQAGSGPAIETLLRLDPSEGRTLRLDAMSDEALARLIAADGVTGAGVAAVLATAGGLPGVARREAAAWAERAASDHLAVAAASSLDATAVAAGARDSMFDDVLTLVAARARRDELTSSTWVGRQPYRALAAYEPQDADLYVGRERLVAELAARVLGSPLVAVIGASGSGKSSLVRAGLVPLVRSGLLPGSGPWRTTVIVPGADPAPALDAIETLDEPGPQLLVVDQFEEGFAAGSAEAWAGRILDVVLDSALDVHAVIVLRADQYGALAAIPSLAALVEDAQLLVGPPTDDELRRIVGTPARRTGCSVEPALVDMIAADVAGHDAALPLVSAALAEVWEQRTGDTLTADGYVRLGGLAAAVERMGTRAVQRSGSQADVREVMLRLVDVTEHGQWVRRPLPIVDVPDRLAGAVDALVDARLVQRDDQHVDVVHEVVLHAWPRLAAWLEEARAELVLERQLRSAAGAWDAGGRRDDDLPRGARLLTGEEFVGRHADVSPVIREFAAAGRHVAERDAQERDRQQARVNRRLRAFLAATAVLLAAAIVAGTLAVRQARRADREAAAAEGKRVSALALATPDVERALLLAVEGARLDDSTQTKANLMMVLTRRPVPPPASVPVDTPSFVDVSPDGDVIASVEGGRVVLRDAATLDVVARSPDRAEFGPPTAIAFSPDGALLASIEGSHLLLRRASTLDVVRGADVGARGPVDLIVFDPRGGRLAIDLDNSPEPVRLYDTATLQQTVTLGDYPEGWAWGIEFSGDGRLLVALDDADPPVLRTLVWDTSAPSEPVVRIDHEKVSAAPNSEFEVSPDWSHLYVDTYPSGDIAIFDLTTGEQVAVESSTVGEIGFGPDGTRLSRGPDGTLRVIDAGTLDEVRSLPMPAGDGSISGSVFSADGRRLVAVGAETGRLYRWDLTTDDGPQVIGSVDSAGGTVLVNPAHDSVYTVERGRLTAWDIGGGRAVVERSMAPAEPDVDTEFTMVLPGGQVAYMAGNFLGSAPGGSMQILDVGTGRLGATVDLHHGGLTRVDSTADGSRLATTGADGVIRVWDTSTGALLAERRLADDLITGVVYIDGDTRLLVSEVFGDVYVVDAETLEPVGRRVATGRELGVPFARPAEPPAVVMTASGHVLLIDLAAGQVVEDLDPGFTGWWAASAPDGQRLAVVGTGGEVRLYDVAERRWTGSPVQAHRGEQTFVDFSRDGSTFLTSGSDGRLGLWDGVTGELLGTVVPGDVDVPIRAAYGGDSRTVFAAAADGTTYTWDVEAAHWIEFACAAAGRNLTADEWREAFGGRPYRETCPSP